MLKIVATLYGSWLKQKIQEAFDKRHQAYDNKERGEYITIDEGIYKELAKDSFVSSK